MYLKEDFGSIHVSYLYSKWVRVMNPTQLKEKLDEVKEKL